MSLNDHAHQVESQDVTAPPSSPLRNLALARRKGPQRASTPNQATLDPLLTADDVSRRLNVSMDWVWDHCSRKKPKLPFIRMGDGALRFRASAIEAFIDERERLSAMHSGGRRKA
jgi:predicted DNA-binding transcriptional regulator AlpA